MKRVLIKRSITGYVHFIAFELLFIFRAFFDSGTSEMSRNILTIASIFTAVLIVRLVSIPYIKIHDDMLTIYYDFFYSEKLKVTSIDKINGSVHFFADAHFVLTDKRQIKFNDRYLSKKDKKLLLSYISNGAFERSGNPAGPSRNEQK